MPGGYSCDSTLLRLPLFPLISPGGRTRPLTYTKSARPCSTTQACSKGSQSCLGPLSMHDNRGTTTGDSNQTLCQSPPSCRSVNHRRCCVLGAKCCANGHQGALCGSMYSPYSVEKNAQNPTCLAGSRPSSQRYTVRLQPGGSAAAIAATTVA